MPSEFLIQVIRKETGEVFSWAPGLEVEKQFEDDFIARLGAKGVGLGRTTDHVLTDARAALRELLYDLKKQV